MRAVRYRLVELVRLPGAGAGAVMALLLVLGLQVCWALLVIRGSATVLGGAGVRR
jgi:hypothetical protein